MCDYKTSFQYPIVAVVQSLSRVWLFATLWTTASHASLSLTISQNLLKLISIGLEMLLNHLILCCPLLLPLIFPSIRVFSNESTVPIKWPRYWTCMFSISPSNEHSGLISFKIEWWSPCCPRDSQKSFLVLQFKSVNSLALSLLYKTSFQYPSTLWYCVRLKC